MLLTNTIIVTSTTLEGPKALFQFLLNRLDQAEGHVISAASSSSTAPNRADSLRAQWLKDGFVPSTLPLLPKPSTV